MNLHSTFKNTTSGFGKEEVLKDSKVNVRKCGVMALFVDIIWLRVFEVEGYLKKKKEKI